MLIIVLATTFAKAQPSVFRTNSVVTGTYSKKLKNWVYNPVTKIELSIIFNESTVYINDANNSRYVIDDKVEDEALPIDRDDVAFVFDLTRVGTNEK